MAPLDYVWAGVMAVIAGPAAFEIFGVGIPLTVLMVFGGFLLGVIGGATPGLAGPFLMAVSLPILLSIFGFTPDALLPVLGFLVGVMKGATVGGAVPAILFNTPGTPDAMMTTLDGYPMAQKGQAGKALRTAHFASVSGDTFFRPRALHLRSVSRDHRRILLGLRGKGGADHPVDGLHRRRGWRIADERHDRRLSGAAGCLHRHG